MSKTSLYLRYGLYALVGLAVLGAGFLFIKNTNDLDRFLINAILGLSVFVTLNTGLLSLANAGFMAIGAYGSAIFIVKVGLPFPLAVLGAMLVCGLVGLVIGLPVLRLSDVYLAIATLGFGEVVRVLIVTTPDLTGGATGANLSTGFPYDQMKQTQTWMLLVFLAILIYLFYFMARSKTGRAFRAIRQNASAASTMGINVVFYRNLAFTISAIIAGAGGALYAGSVGSLDNNDFRFNKAVDILSYAVLGGSTHWFGPILGAGLLTALPIFLREVLGGSIEIIQNFVQLPNIINGALLMLVIIFLPGGLYAPSRGWSFRALFQRPKAEDRKIEAAGSENLPAASKNGDEPEIPISPPLASNSQTLLELQAVKRTFGGVTAVDDVSFAIRAGGIYGLIGPNGAGKTTLINLISGLFRPNQGQVIFQGKNITGKPPHEIAKLGIARTFQNIRLFPEMTVLENVVVGHHARIQTNLLTTWLQLPQERREESEARTEALDLLQRLGLSSFAQLPASKLSYGDQRRVEIARALALDPRLLLLDEPAAGMNSIETQRLAEFILELKRQGYTILVIEHHMDLIMQVSDEILVLNFGRKIAQDVPVQVQQNEQVIEAYLGKE